MPEYDDTLPLSEVLRRVFPRADPPGIEQLLAGAPGEEPLPERVRLACVLLSAGDLGRLRHYVRQARLDARDVLYWAFHYGDEAPAHLRGLLRAARPRS
jgi:hypothetical protein